MMNYQPVRLIQHPVVCWGVLVLVVLVFAWGGYKAGLGSDPVAEVRKTRSREVSANDGRPRQARGEGGMEVVRRLLREDPSQWDRVRQLEAWEQVREELIRMWQTSPSINDWELRRETHRLLSKLTADELATLYQELDWGTLGVMWLRQASLTEWALKDGPAAVTQSVKKGEMSNNACSAFATWAFKDPDAALVWLRDVELPPPLADSKDQILLNFLINFAKVNFERVREEFAYMSPKSRTSMLSSLTGYGPSDPDFAAKVSELSKQYTDPQSALIVERSFVTKMAEADAVAALDRISKTELPVSDIAELYLAVLDGQARKQPAEAFGAWLARNPATESLPEKLVPVMDQSFWSDEGRREMIGWLDTLPEGPARDAFYEHATRLVATGSEFEKAASYADAIADPAKRLSAIKTLRNMWTGRNPEAAGIWLDRLPQEDRQALGL